VSFFVFVVGANQKRLSCACIDLKTRESSEICTPDKRGTGKKERNALEGEQALKTEDSLFIVSALHFFIGALLLFRVSVAAP